MQIRLNKFLAERLGISRREADAAIEAGLVTIDGKPAVLGARVEIPFMENSSDPETSPSVLKTPRNPSNSSPTTLKALQTIDKFPKVCYNGKKVPFCTDFLYLKFHKPVGYVCSRRAQGAAPTLYELLPPKYQKLKTVGRLDKDSSGLILLTNDGDFAFQMTHPKFQKTKLYEVVLNQDLLPLHQQMISDFGIELDDGRSQFLVVRDEKYEDRRHFLVSLHEGRNRQIRRTFAALGYRVTKLHRQTFGDFELLDLKPGEFVEIVL